MADGGMLGRAGGRRSYSPYLAGHRRTGNANAPKRSLDSLPHALAVRLTVRPGRTRVPRAGEQRWVLKGWAGPSHCRVGVFGHPVCWSGGLSCSSSLSPAHWVRYLPWCQRWAPVSPSQQCPAGDAETQCTHVTPECLRVTDGSCWRGKGGSPPCAMRTLTGCMAPRASTSPSLGQFYPENLGLCSTSGGDRLKKRKGWWGQLLSCAMARRGWGALAQWVHWVLVEPG